MSCYQGGSFSSWLGGDVRRANGAPCRPTAVLACLAVGVVLCAAAGVNGAAPAAGAVASPKTPNQEAIAWLDHFATEQVLFHDQDIARIRKRMAAMSPSKAQQWLDETAGIRRELDSPEWQKTRQWLRGFLKVQAIYTDKDLKEFREKAIGLQPAELRKIMQEAEACRAKFADQETESARFRQQTMEINHAFTQEEFNQRQAIRRAASQGSNFDTTKNTKVTGKPSYATRSNSLSRSLGIARRGIYGGMWGGW
jgi:hypothetical protein